MADSHDLEDRTYWSHLGSIGIQAVHAERDHIQSERTSLASGTRSLAFDHYRTFIATSDCGKDAAVHLKGGRESVERLSEKLPPLRDACLSFETEAKNLSARRKSTSLVLARHTRLLEVLELPQLVETCVRNAHYDEALELCQYATRIEKKLGNIPIELEVVKAVKQSLKVMLNQLLSQLRAPIQLPACLKVVGYLRRMDAYGETELRLRFLQARDAWLTSVLKTVPTDDPYEHLTKSLELNRVHLFDIVAQYRALFSDEDPLVGPDYAAGQSPACHRLLFSTWLERKIADFLLVLRHDLKQGAKRQSLDSILVQAMYFGQSFGRVGADFRPALVSIFSEATLDLALERLHGLEIQFKSGIDQLALKASVTSTTDNSKKSNSGADQGSGDPFQPPLSLLDYPPLAELCNSVLMSLNEIRLCAPISLAPKIIRRVQEVLVGAANSLKDRELRFGKSSTDTEKATFKKLVTAFAVDLVPFCDKCLRRLFPVQDQMAVTPDAKFTLDVNQVYEHIPLKEAIMPLVEPRATATTASGGAPGLDQTNDNAGDNNGDTNTTAYVIDRTNMIDQEIAETLPQATTSTTSEEVDDTKN